MGIPNVGQNVIEALLGILGTAMLAIFGWAFTLNARISVVEEGYKNLEKLLDAKFDSFIKVNAAIGDKIETQFEATGQRLDRIERSMNGHLHRD